MTLLERTDPTVYVFWVYGEELDFVFTDTEKAAGDFGGRQTAQPPSWSPDPKSNRWMWWWTISGGPHQWPLQVELLLMLADWSGPCMQVQVLKGEGIRRRNASTADWAATHHFAHVHQ